MLKERQAREHVRTAWADWGGKSGAPSDKSAFYEWLTENRPHLLRFKSAVDKRTLVLTWLTGR